MLKENIKRKITIVSIAFFLSTSLNFSFVETVSAARMMPPKQGPIINQPPPRRAVSKPVQRPRAIKPVAKPIRPPVRQNIKAKPAIKSGSRIKPKPNTRINRPVIKQNRNIKPKPKVVKPRPSNNIKHPNTNIKPSNKKIIRPPHKISRHKRPPISSKDKINKKGFHNDKKHILIPKPNKDKFSPIKDKKPTFRPNHDREHLPIPPKHNKLPRPHHKFKLHDRFVPPPQPQIHYRTPRWLLFAGGFIYTYPQTVVNHVVVDYSYLNTVNDVYLDNFIKTKYIEGEYEGQNYYADYYIDKNSLEVVQYDPPDYIIRVNEVSFDNMNEDNSTPYITTWEFKYNIDYHTVYFRNVYDSYQIDPKDWTFLNTYNDEYYLLPTAEMAFYLAYEYRFFDNQPDSFYEIETL